MSRGAFWCACALNKTLGSLANDGHVFLSCKLFGVRHSSTGACRLWCRVGC